ncbi:hypothetical protein Tco_0941278 [Tanacetum coccineum]|uniref:Gag/pol protein n=1 Tax=Tanacetum coccineum TaxID=301880 RepID=A0ABQ5DT15_9ASTR
MQILVSDGVKGYSPCGLTAHKERPSEMLSLWKTKFKKMKKVERYRARLVVKRYAQKEGINFNEIFLHGRRSTMSSVLGMCATSDIHLEQLEMRKPHSLWKSWKKKITCAPTRRFNMQDCKPISTPFPTDVKLSSKMSPSNEKERMEMSRVPYASAVGSLMFAMICTRPDIAHAVGVVSRYMAEPGRGHWDAVKRILRYIKGTSDVALCFGDSDLIVKGYVDSDYAGDLDGSKSTTGYVFTLSGGTVSWVSKLQSVVAMSTTEAEYVAAAQASKEAVWLKMLLEELGHKQENYSIL